MEVKLTEVLSPFQETYLDAAIKSINHVLPNLGHTNCCIGATRLLREVVRDWMKVSPCSVQLQVWNPVMLRAHLRHAAGEVIRDADMKGAYYLYADGKDCNKEENWPGHLVGLISGRVLVDLTLPQCNRPKQGIILKPLVALVGPDWAAGGVWANFDMEGCWLRYCCRPNDQTWQEAPDWNFPHLHVRAFRLVRERLEDLEITPNRRKKRCKKS